MIKLESVNYSFGTKTLLSSFSFSARAGEIVCFSGPSGSGKTTALELLAGTLHPASGLRSTTALRIGYAFQDDCLIPWRSAEENLLFVLAASPRPGQAREICAYWLAQFLLGEASTKKPAQLSGGMKRRLNIARAFCIEPELLLLDEPFAFQDESAASLIAGQISAAAARGAAVIYAAHEPDFSLFPSLRAVPIAKL